MGWCSYIYGNVMSMMRMVWGGLRTGEAGFALGYDATTLSVYDTLLD